MSSRDIIHNLSKDWRETDASYEFSKVNFIDFFIIYLFIAFLAKAYKNRNVSVIMGGIVMVIEYF